MHNVLIEQWGPIEQKKAKEIRLETDYEVFEFTDLKTIKRSIAEPHDLSLALQEVGESLHDYKKQVVATKRNQNNDGWLALCIKNE